MDFLDCLIGAAAHHHGLVLYTLNDRHFAPLPGLHTSLTILMTLPGQTSADQD